MGKTKTPEIAIIDIGSNSIRLEIFRAPFTPNDRSFKLKSSCALAEGLQQNGEIQKDGEDCLVQTMTRFKNNLKGRNIIALSITATEAMRRAENQKELLARVKKETGFDIQILSEDEECRLAGEALLLEQPDYKGLVADLGGGSLDIACIENGEVVETKSLPLGYKILESVSDMKSYMEDQLATLPKSFQGAETLVPIGGMWRKFSRAYAMTHDFEIGSELQNLVQPSLKFRQFAAQLRKGKNGLDPIALKVPEERISHMLPAQKLLRKMIKMLDIQKVQLSSATLRHALLAEAVTATHEQKIQHEQTHNEELRLVA